MLCQLLLFNTILGLMIRLVWFGTSRVWILHNKSQLENGKYSFFGHCCLDTKLFPIEEAHGPGFYICKKKEDQWLESIPQLPSYNFLDEEDCGYKYTQKKNRCQRTVLSNQILNPFRQNNKQNYQDENENIGR